MTKPANIESIENATGKTWNEWLAFLDGHDAAAKSHKEIAQLVHDSLEIESAGWWAQSVAVAYEQHIGRRAAGQRNDGSYEMSVTRTIEGDREQIFETACALLDQLTIITESNVTNRRTSVTPVRSYWRCDLERGDKVAIALEAKSDSKVLISATQTNLASKTAADEARVYWKAWLSEL